MSRFKSYSPDQAYLLPPSVRDELGGNHLCFFVRGVVERLDMTMFEQSYGVEGGELYAPQLMLACGFTLILDSRLLLMHRLTVLQVRKRQ